MSPIHDNLQCLHIPTTARVLVLPACRHLPSLHWFVHEKLQWIMWTVHVHTQNTATLLLNTQCVFTKRSSLLVRRATTMSKLASFASALCSNHSQLHMPGGGRAATQMDLPLCATTCVCVGLHSLFCTCRCRHLLQRTCVGCVRHLDQGRGGVTAFGSFPSHWSHVSPPPNSYWLQCECSCTPEVD